MKKQRKNYLLKLFFSFFYLIVIILNYNLCFFKYNIFIDKFYDNKKYIIVILIYLIFL